MLKTNQHNNSNTWTVSSSREYCYKVIETSCVFNPDNKLLLTDNTDSQRRFVILDKKLHKSHYPMIKDYFDTHNISSTVIAISAQEKNKTFKTLRKIYKELDKFGLRRRSEPVIIIGGGVVLDVASFAVDSYRRGVPYIRIPTTLMAYIDVALGVKTGINHNGYKNRVGSFSAPIANILDRSFFRSLSRRHVVNGVAEIIKMAVIKDIHLFELLEQEAMQCIDDKFLTTGDEILKRAVHSMLEELAPNLFEDKLERLVDFGHTFSGNLEMHNISKLLHGEAVAIDMCLTCMLSHVKGILNQEDTYRIIDLIFKLNLPITNKKMQPAIMWNSLHDRTLHRDGLQRMPLPSEIGKATFANDITYAELCKAIQLLNEYNRELKNVK